MAGKIQNEDIKSAAELVAAGATAASLPNDTKIYVTAKSINKTLSQAIIDNDLALANPMTADGDIIVGGASGVPTRLAKGTDGQYLRLASGTPAWQTPTLPTVQRFLSGSGTYTTPANVKYLKVTMVGGGGGGSGSGSAAGTAATGGGSTTFGTSLLTASGGTQGTWNGSGPSGGSVIVNSPAITIIGISGGRGSGPLQFSAGVNNPNPGLAGGSSGFGVNSGTSIYNSAGYDGVTNSGGGGGGGGGNNTANVETGTSGAAGGYLIAIIPSPSATYSYAVGAGGTAGGAGTGGKAGGAGAAGQIIVEEYY